jgi:predicted GNAT family acetyltransferase
MKHLLDNPIWSALRTGNKNLAQGTENVKYYPFDVAPFAGLKENISENFKMLYDITPVDADIFGIVTTTETNIPEPWSIVHCTPLLQMVCENPIIRKEFSEPIINLSDEYISQMLALTHLTNPGPFRQRTIDYGHYQGIFEGEKLVAMAGQRMHAIPYAEISAVCTHPDYLGRGYAAQLMLNQIKRIKETGEIPFLHVAAINERAIKIYESMGFETRKNLFVYLIKK